MKMYTLVLVVLLVMIAIPDIFFYLHLKRKDSKPIYIILHIIPAILFSALFFYIKFGLEHSQNFRIIAWIMWMYFFFLLIYIPKIIHVIFYFLHYVYKKLVRRESIYFDVIRILLTVFVVIIMLISAYITPRNFEVTHVQVVIPNLPASFNGYKIVQISDIHLGSWNRKFKKIEPLIKLVNDQHADIIVFTGDMVNNFADETKGWQRYFIKLHAKNGKYAITGNHDYGDYTDWKSEKDRDINRFRIKQSIRDFGFRLLLNEHVYLKEGMDSIMLVGVENWGKTKQSRYSDLNKAVGISAPTTTRILLSHDPTHFEDEVLGHKDINLTLAGHTHASQLAIKIGKRLFSPVSFVFKYWVGLYNVDGQYLYVNRGIGYIGLPMMSVGVRPEITVIELKNKP